MMIEKRFNVQAPMKNYTHMRTLATKLNDIFIEYDFVPLSNGYEIDIRSNKLRYKRVKMQWVTKKGPHNASYQLTIPEKGRLFDCGRLPELQDPELLKKALDLEIRAIDGSW